MDHISLISLMTLMYLNSQVHKKKMVMISVTFVKDGKLSEKLP